MPAISSSDTGNVSSIAGVISSVAGKPSSVGGMMTTSCSRTVMSSPLGEVAEMSTPSPIAVTVPSAVVAVAPDVSTSATSTVAPAPAGSVGLNTTVPPSGRSKLDGASAVRAFGSGVGSSAKADVGTVVTKTAATAANATARNDKRMISPSEKGVRLVIEPGRKPARSRRHPPPEYSHFAHVVSGAMSVCREIGTMPGGRHAWTPTLV